MTDTKETSDLQKLLDEATPGPWKADGNLDVYAGYPAIGTRVDVAEICAGDDSDEANARLIAMAPDLAAALILAKEALAKRLVECGERDGVQRVEHSWPEKCWVARVGPFGSEADARATLDALDAIRLLGGEVMDDTKELVACLRALVILDEVRSNNALGREAADEIERLSAALADMTRQRDAARKQALEEALVAVLEVAARGDIPGGCLLPDTFEAGLEAAYAAIRALAEGAKL